MDAIRLQKRVTRSAFSFPFPTHFASCAHFDCMQCLFFFFLIVRDSRRDKYTPYTFLHFSPAFALASHALAINIILFEYTLPEEHDESCLSLI